jgi:hypothetical protein
MGYLSNLGIMIFLVGLAMMIMGRRSRGEMSGSYGKAKGVFKGPIWFLFMVIGFFLIAIDPFVPIPV